MSPMIKRLLSRSAGAGAEDVLATKRALAAAGLYKIPEWGLTSFPDEAMFVGIEALQRRVGHPRPDGEVRPGDDTARQLAQSNSGAARQAGNGGMIHVSAHEQNRSGHATPISEHFRGPPGQGGGQGLPPGVPPVANPQVRGKDGYGKGHYGATRTDARKNPLPPHKGVDLVTTPGETVKSPVAGVVKEPYFDPYWADPDKKGNLSAIRIATDDGHVVDILYVDTDATGLKKGDRVIAGQSIGTAQDLSTVYPPKKEGIMTNHIHIRIKGKDGVDKDPTPLVRGRR